MTRFYKRPILLIEFDPNKSFSLQVSVPECAVTLGNFSHSLLYIAISRNGYLFCAQLVGTRSRYASSCANCLSTLQHKLQDIQHVFAI